ncbi:hypothetical protein MUG87_18675 [Ectobacillus sp. JY-23]|uniref:hypothetical protein n=1 Tax=Ectobacillus sp. JY-23 TaxID=2933872 RepID=UPI001FF400C6|nr:hypothetical protein [Ectobacillus sp. JY-23]UOY92419.1 hypothetical protein MUG87_18675 [Ectobacillus sp. JY-23]
MKKRYIVFVAALILLAVLSYIFFFSKRGLTILSEADIGHPSFLQDKQAVVYLSTTADQDMDGKGFSYAIFIDRKGRAAGYQMKGLESGNINISDDKKQLLLETKDSIRLIGKKAATYKTKYQHTGEYNTYLPKEQRFVNIYNSGFDKKNGGYNSNVIHIDRKGIHTANIPHYLMSEGKDGEKVVIIGNEQENDTYIMRSITFAGTSMSMTDPVVLNLPKTMTYSSVSSIVSDAKYHYQVIAGIGEEETEMTYVLRIDKETAEVDLTPIYEKARSFEDAIAIIPFDTERSAYLYEDKLYYIDGLGDMITFDTKTKAVSRKFKIDYHVTDGVRFHEQSYFEKDRLYVLRHDFDRKHKYYIEEYSLHNGEKVKETDVIGMDKLLKSVPWGKKIYSYDFIMLQKE